MEASLLAYLVCLHKKCVPLFHPFLRVFFRQMSDIMIVLMVGPRDALFHERPQIG